MQENIEDVLAARKKTHGEYSEHARVTQDIMRIYMSEPAWNDLPDIIKETLHMDAHKSARIITGNPFLHDHYVDKSGYCNLVVQRTIDGVGLKPEHNPNSGFYGKVQKALDNRPVTDSDSREMPEEKQPAPPASYYTIVFDVEGFRIEEARRAVTTALDGRPLSGPELTEGQPLRGVGLGGEILTEERLAAALAHAVNFHSLEHALGDRPDYEIAAQLVTEVSKHLRGETDAQVSEIIRRCLRHKADCESREREGYDVYGDVGLRLNMSRDEAKKLVCRYLYGNDMADAVAPRDAAVEELRKEFQELSARMASLLQAERPRVPRV